MLLSPSIADLMDDRIEDLMAARNKKVLFFHVYFTGK
jgi:hypothetical protein